MKKKLKELDKQIKDVKNEIIKIENIPLDIIPVKNGRLSGGVFVVKSIHYDEGKDLAADIKMAKENDVYEGLYWNNYLLFNNLNGKYSNIIYGCEDLGFNLKDSLINIKEDKSELINKKTEQLRGLYEKQSSLLYDKLLITNEALKIIYPIKDPLGDLHGVIEDRKLLNYYRRILIEEFEDNYIFSGLDLDEVLRFNFMISVVEENIFLNPDSTKPYSVNRLTHDDINIIEDYVPSNKIFDMYKDKFNQVLERFFKTHNSINEVFKNKNKTYISSGKYEGYYISIEIKEIIKESIVQESLLNDWDFIYADIILTNGEDIWKGDQIDDRGLVLVNKLGAIINIPLLDINKDFKNLLALSLN